MNGLRSARFAFALAMAASVMALACSDSAPKLVRTAPVGPAPDSFRVDFETVLKKKVQAIWGDGDDPTDPRRAR
ncbi:hypothetical protein BH09GEM1_BH09GEM1_24640 [soil metagenome]